jgi:hypothetical protein
MVIIIISNENYSKEKENNNNNNSLSFKILEKGSRSDSFDFTVMGISIPQKMSVLQKLT